MVTKDLRKQHGRESHIDYQQIQSKIYTGISYMLVGLVIHFGVTFV